MVYLSKEDTDDDDALQRWMHTAISVDGWWTLQEYVERPLLYRGRKFDLRVWAVLTSIDPLRVFLLRKAFPKVSTVPYSAAASVVGQHCLSSAYCACMHVRMPMGEGCRASMLVSPYPEHTELTLFRRGLRFGRDFAGRGAPAQEGALWDRVVMPQIERTICLAVLLARAEPLAQHKRLLAAGLRYRRFLMLSPDFIVDERGRVFVEEINTNGFMVGDSNELYKTQQDTIDMLRVLGADGWPKRPLYAAHSAAIANGFLQRRKYDAHDEALVKPSLLELQHEEVAAHSTPWYRIFPARDDQSHLELLEQGDGFATDLDDATTDFLRYRSETINGEQYYAASVEVNATAEEMFRSRSSPLATPVAQRPHAAEETFFRLLDSQ